MFSLRCMDAAAVRIPTAHLQEAGFFPDHAVRSCGHLPVRWGNMAVATRYDQQKAHPARNLGMLLDFALRSHGRAVALLMLVALINFLPGFFEIPPLDRDEARFAQ